jgi:hypothetical protein
MGQVFAVNKLPKNLRNKVFQMLDNPAMTQLEIVTAINAEAGKNIISKSSLCRFIESREKTTGTKRGIKAPSTEESLTRIATALERIAFSLEKQYKKPS